VLFVKVAQWLTIQPNLFSPKLKKELQSLLDNCPQHSYKHSLKEIKNIKGLKITTDVIGCGSIAQVHLGQYYDKKCVVKIVHPNISKELEENGKILYKILRFIPIELEEILPHWINQSNLLYESRNIELLKNAFANFIDIKVPDVYYTSKNVIVQEYIDALKYNKLSIDLKETADILRIASFFYLTFVKNLLHCDLHPGNILYSIDSKKKIKLILIDPSPIISITNKNSLQDLIENINNNYGSEVVNIIKTLNMNPLVNYNTLEKNWNMKDTNFTNSKKLVSWCRKENVMIPGDISVSCIAYCLISSKFKHVNEKSILYLSKYCKEFSKFI
jgi:predicted unusual protein kinase regulating ubiquinone biosynthesis (AarF/ABC1/UbiB family)